MKAAAAVLALVLLLSGIHVTLPLGAWPITIPLPVLALLAELGACWLITRAAVFRSHPSPRRTA